MIDMIDSDQLHQIKTRGLEAWHQNQLTRDGIKKTSLFRKKIVDLAGGACIACGYAPTDIAQYAAMDFHHRDATTKSFTLNTSAMGRAWPTVQAEIAKCDLVCANCHRIMHFGRLSRPRKKIQLVNPNPHWQEPAKRVIPFTSTSSEEAGIEVEDAKEGKRRRRNEAYRQKILRRLGLTPAIVERVSA